MALVSLFPVVFRKPRVGVREEVLYPLILFTECVQSISWVPGSLLGLGAGGDTNRVPVLTELTVRGLCR